MACKLFRTAAITCAGLLLTMGTMACGGDSSGGGSSSNAPSLKEQTIQGKIQGSD